MKDRRPFWDKVDRSQAEGCWPWLGYRRKSGHGLTQHRYTPMNASRKAWILTHGEIDAGLCVLHRCDNALCCNPSHMYLGTRADNMIDLWGQEAGELRGPRGRRCVMTDEQVSEMVAERSKGATLVELAKKFHTHHETIRRRLKERGYRTDRLANARGSMYRPK